MLRLLAMAVILSGCMVSAAGSGTDGNVSWAFTINNTLPASAVPPGGGGGLLVVVTYGNGTSATYLVPPGGSVTVPANGSAAVVSGGGAIRSVGPGGELFWTSTGWSASPPAPAGGG